MTSAVKPTEIDQAVALDWLRYSLSQGEVVSPAALKLIEEHRGRSFTLVPDTVDPGRLATPQYGGMSGMHAAREALSEVLIELAKQGAACVVVEDEGSLKSHPNPSVGGLLRTGFVGEEVIHWADLSGGTDATMLMLRRGTAGYPTNAFVTSASAEMLELVDGGELDVDIAGGVVRSLMAVIVAAYDNETYLIWQPT